MKDKNVFCNIKALFTALPQNPSIVVLTGAGISAESGLETFRDKGGVWSRYSIEEVATPEAFVRNPDMVHEFYNLRRAALRDPAIKPNDAHHALVRLEEKAKDKFFLVTQNVDDLHDRAGSRNLIHMHGELFKNLCALCGGECISREDLSRKQDCGVCQKRGGLRPGVVWFGERPHAMDDIYKALLQCDLFISVGTSGHVYPAAGFVMTARESGAKTLEINLEQSENADVFHAGIYGPAGKKLPSFVDQLLESCF